jgi:UDP-GlcNAc:undecaprenyl-phosphate GlcNAc-1-phosphate transferase
MTLTDDLRRLPSWIRLLLQTFIGFVLFAIGTRIYTITNPLGGIIKLDTFDVFLPQLSTFVGPLPLWSGVFTIAWIVLTTNAANWLDGVPGQVSILTALSALTLGLLSLSSRVSQPEIALIAFIVSGTALASAFFDLRGKTVLGDTGAMFYGLLLGTLSIYAGGKVATLLLAFGVPILDAFFVIAERLLKGASPFRGGNDHLHHLLINKGWRPGSVILLTVALGALFGITALFLSTLQKFIALLFFTALILALRIFAQRTPSVSRSPQTPP